MLKTTFLSALFSQCAPDINPVTLHALIGVESAGKPYVVANVTKGTSHYFDEKTKAIAFLNELKSKKEKYSAGLMQIYVDNFKGYQLNNENVFDHCKNIKVGADILKQCFVRASKIEGDPQLALRKAFSCYYSNNFIRGFKKEGDGKSYVERIENKAEKNYSVPDIRVNIKNASVSQAEDKDALLTQENNENKSSQVWDVFGDY